MSLETYSSSKLMPTMPVTSSSTEMSFVALKSAKKVFAVY
jgi:hypothetical protein